MPPETPIPGNVAHAIQLALTPVFLLTGIAGLLNVMASRLGRIIDRRRHLTESTDLGRLSKEHIAMELHRLARRRHFANAAITACTVSALLVCVVIAMLFMEVLFDLPMTWLEGVLFTGATVALVLGLTLFLREIHLAARNVWSEPAPPVGAVDRPPSG
ncbi:MAG: DUF2721 domain-containing protein [Verrucomicrobiales bacterium]|nr:DUF2721 domain-containing protein [Verrucomicrobiales bacterium]